MVFGLSKPASSAGTRTTDLRAVGGLAAVVSSGDERDRAGARQPARADRLRVGSLTRANRRDGHGGRGVGRGIPRVHPRSAGNAPDLLRAATVAAGRTAARRGPGVRAPAGGL